MTPRTSLAGVIIGRTVEPSSAPEDVERLAIVADRRLSLAALSALVLQDATYQLIQQARGVAEVGEMLEAFRPAVVVLDSPGALASASVEPSAWNGRILLLLDPEEDPPVIAEAMRARAHGYLSRTATRQGFEEAVEVLHRTDFYMDPLLVEKILLAKRRLLSSPTALTELSQRERAILSRIASGNSTKEVARAYAITPKTVGNHINNIYQKLNLSNRGELVLYAMQEGLTRFEAQAPAATPDRITTAS